jgi:hypothetical protein
MTNPAPSTEAAEPQDREGIRAQVKEWLERIIQAHTQGKDLDQLGREQALAAAGREARAVFEACLLAVTRIRWDSRTGAIKSVSLRGASPAERNRLAELLKRCASDPDLFEVALLGRPPRWPDRLTDHPAEPSGDDVVAGESAPTPERTPSE